MSRHKGDIPSEGEAALRFENSDHRKTRRHQCRLGVFGQGEVVVRPFEHQARQILRQSFVDFLKQPARRRKRSGEGTPHADHLRALTRKYECPLHPDAVPPSSALLPVRAGVIAGSCLGARVEAFGPDGTPVTGQVGELVLTAPMPSMPVGFWNDPAGERYRASYFTPWPGVWRHGDWITMLPDGGCVIFGRSDATLNRGGVRMGTSEFYRVVEQLPEVADSLVVDTGQLGAAGRLILYLVLTGDTALDDDLTRRIKAALRAALSPRHVPDEIYQVPGIPRTLSGKKLEVPVRKILLGTPVAEAADPDALANPEVLAWFSK